MASSLVLAFPNRIEVSVVSGGSWVSTLPASNVRTRVLGQVARTTNAATTSTILTIDLHGNRPIGALALMNHNLSAASRYRWLGATDSTFTTIVYQGPFTDGVPGASHVEWDPAEFEWESDNAWLGNWEAAEFRQTLTQTAIHLLPSARSARYWRLEIQDATNPDGYVQIGRIFIGDTWRPRVNYAYGGGLAHETDTAVKRSIGGAEYFDIRETYRVFRFSLEHMTNDEGFSQALEMTRRLGLHGEVLVVPDPDDSANAVRRNFVGRLRTLNALEQPFPNTTSMSFEIKEVR